MLLCSTPHLLLSREVYRFEPKWPNCPSSYLTIFPLRVRPHTAVWAHVCKRRDVCAMYLCVDRVMMDCIKYRHCTIMIEGMVISLNCASVRHYALVIDASDAEFIYF